MSREQHTRLGLIGYGAIAHEIMRKVSGNASIEIVGALVLQEDQSKDAPFPLVTDLGELLELEPNLIAECASHDAVNAYGEPILAKGLDLMIISIGALADADLHHRVKAAAERSCAQVILPAGALIGVDGLAAARRAGLEWVRLTSCKPPLAWAGAPGVEGVDLAAIAQETVIFDGTAREAARLFPKNANVAATAALAGTGFDKTKVTLIADPAVDRNRHLLEFEGQAGYYRVETTGITSPDNPKTSMLTAYAILRAIETRSAAVVI